ncbi:MAG TPA: transglycosylase SLT domain-containing protein [Thermoanaerobaculia bacterium]|jgi:membrane-bound lytic murein transglycosylase D|nr:transglycosylase SLT domain-containing protein [Thermoanaerobaculia bacterium]
MNRERAVVLLIAIYAVACASSTPAPKLATAPALQPPSAAKLQAEEYRKALEAAYGEIVAREGKPVAAPTVDVEAAASIPIPDHPTIRGALQYFTTDLKPSIQESLLRSGKYKKLIDKALDDYKLPHGLAYLPVIESAYVPSVTSRAGAHGIWQFMPETARDYGLRVDWWVDERADPERSTRAAAAYLKDLYKQFNDWPLALAAYNAGPGRIRRAMQSSGSVTFWDLLENEAVPKETRGYVPTFFATLTIASDPSTYGFRLGTPIDFDRSAVEIEGPLSLRYLASIAHVDEALLRDLNPALRQGIVPPGKVTVHVPPKSAETVAARAATLKNEDANIAVCSYTLREGESLKRIARALGTDIETLTAMNNLRSPDAIGEGDAVYLPVRARELGALLAHSDAYYAVRKGDTYYSIAKSHNLTVDVLLELNELEIEHTLHPGERLRITAPRAVSAGGM